MTSSGERDTVGLSAPGLLHGIRPCALQHAYPVAGPWRRVVVLPHASHHDALFVAGRRRSPSARAGLADACICAGDAPSQSEKRHRAEKAWSAMLPVPKRAIPRDIVSVSFSQAGGVLGRRVSLTHGRDTYAEDTATQDGAWGVIPRESMPQSACRVMGLFCHPLARTRSTVLNSVAFQTKGGEGFSRRSGLQKKPPEMHIFLR
jgi:hypothetical protein